MKTVFLRSTKVYISQAYNKFVFPLLYFYVFLSMGSIITYLSSNWLTYPKSAFLMGTIHLEKLCLFRFEFAVVDLT
jgi:hypothetical protein